jgi:hypothetical protein
MSAKTAEPDAKHVTNYCAIRRREKKRDHGSIQSRSHKESIA